jgi:hypothetical protein
VGQILVVADHLVPLHLAHRLAPGARHQEGAQQLQLAPLELKEALGNEVMPDVVMLKRLVTSVPVAVLNPEANDRFAACAKTYS